MGISDLFRPNWKHSNSRVRAAAVKALEPSQVEPLLEVAEKDSDALIRALAVDRLEDPETLEALARRATDATVASLARQRADALWMAMATQDEDEESAVEALARIGGTEALVEVVRKSRLASIQCMALERLEDAKALCEVVRTAKGRDMVMAALAKLSDQALLRGLVLEEARREIAQAALDRIEDEESLKLIAQRAKVKAIRTRARKQLDSMQASDAPDPKETLEQKKLHAQLVQLCREVEGLSGSTQWDATLRRMEEAGERWSQLTAAWTDSDPRLVERFENARTGFALRLEHANTARKKQESTLAQRDAARKEHSAEREARERILTQILKLPSDAAPEDLAALRQEWEALGPVPEELRAELEGRLEAAEAQWRREAKSTVTDDDREAAFGELLAAAEVSLQEGRVGAIKRAFEDHRRSWRRLEEKLGRSEDLRARFGALEARCAQLEADERSAREEERVRNLTRLERLASHAEGALQRTQLAQVDRVLKEINSALIKPGALPSREAWAALRPRFEALREQLLVHLRELRDEEEWKRWDVSTRQEKLVQEVEALKDVEPLAEVATRLRRAQAEWKKAGPGSRGRGEELWVRFKAASDEAYARCESYFQEQDAERKACLGQKTALCEEIEAIQNSEDFVEVAERIKALQQRWKEIGPVPRKQSDAVWKRFRTACDHFFDRRKVWQKQEDAKRVENLAAKETICARAEELAESTDWDVAANSFKALQAEWKAIGPVPRSKADALWSRFRRACDHFFDRRKEYMDEGRTSNLSKRLALLDDLSRLLDSPPDGDPSAVGAKCVEAWDAWKKLSPVPTDQEGPTQERLRGVLFRAMSGHRAGFLGTMLDPTLTVQKMEGLCEKAESLAAEVKAFKSQSSADSIDPGDAEAMAAALKEALAASAFRKDFQQEDAARIADQSAALRRSWEQLGPVPEEDASPFLKRFQAASKTVSAILRPQGRGR